MPLIAPSLLAADFLHLSEEISFLNDSADILHIDVMDGVFVPNISYGFPITEAVAKVAVKPMDVHLMITAPEKYALKFAAIQGVKMVSFHIESQPEPVELLEKLRAAGVKAGLVANPDYPIEKLFPFLEHCDFVLVMSVFAGFGGQKFIEETYSRVRTLKDEITRRGIDVKIEVDGGVSTSNSAALSAAGADILVAGTAVFKAEDPAAVISSMR